MTMLDKKIKQWEREVRQLQRELADSLTELAGEFATDTNKRLLVSEANLAKLQQVDARIERFNRRKQMALLAGIVLVLKDFTGDIVDYYRDMGLKPRPSRRVDRMLSVMRRRIGLLSGLEPVNMEVKQYMINSIANNKSMSQYIRGLRQMFLARGRQGLLERYYNQHLFDSIMQFERITANFYAEQLKLNWFIYEGGLIETSRQFCIKRDGRLFHRDDTKRWRFDTTLPGPETADAYNPLTDLGRWNCRHWLRWITDDMAKKIKADES